jgi:hypothetical protein
LQISEQNDVSEAKVATNSNIDGSVVSAFEMAAAGEENLEKGFQTS